MVDAHTYSDLTTHCFINAPFKRLQRDLLNLFLQYHFQPEIGLEGDCLWNCKPEDFSFVAKALIENGLSCTLHAPFQDIVPGGFDQRIVDLSREKLKRAFALLPIFKPKTIVCHLGYEANKHGSNQQRWLDTSLATWSELIGLAEDSNTRVMFENTYETEPSIHKKLLTALGNHNIGFCLDTGHLMAFARTHWHPWLKELAPWLGQLHLHDNNGKNDQHLAVGEGIFDFQALFMDLKKTDLHPVITLEPHSERDLWLSLKNIKQMQLVKIIET